MEDSKPVSTPMVTGHKISKNDESHEVNQTLYRYMIGKLYYVVHSRPDIALVVGIVARFSTNPKDKHMMAIKGIMRYVKGIVEYGLYYKKNENVELKAYTNVDWVGSLDDRKSFSGGAFFLGSRLVSWTSKKKNYISQSTTEVKYVATTVNCSNVVWLKKLLKGMKEDIIEPIIIYYDNTNILKISKNLVMYTKTKHIAISYHYLRELVQDKIVRMEYVNKREKLANIITKSLPKEPHEYLRSQLGVLPLSKAT